MGTAVQRLERHCCCQDCCTVDWGGWSITTQGQQWQSDLKICNCCIKLLQAVVFFMGDCVPPRSALLARLQHPEHLAALMARKFPGSEVFM